MTAVRTLLHAALVVAVLPSCTLFVPSAALVPVGAFDAMTFEDRNRIHHFHPIAGSKSQYDGLFFGDAHSGSDEDLRVSSRGSPATSYFGRTDPWLADRAAMRSSIDEHGVSLTRPRLFELRHGERYWGSWLHGLFTPLPPNAEGAVWIESSSRPR